MNDKIHTYDFLLSCLKVRTFDGLSRPILMVTWGHGFGYFDPSQLIVALLVKSRDNKNNLKRLMFECTSAFDPENTPSPSWEKFFFNQNVLFIYLLQYKCVIKKESRIKNILCINLLHVCGHTNLQQLINQKWNQ